MKCPTCGTQLKIVRDGGAWQPSHTFDMATDAPASAVDFESWTRQAPTRPPTPASDVLVPLCQSAVSGLVCGLSAGVIAYAREWPAWVPLGMFAGAFTTSWFWLLFDHRSLLRTTETIIGRDLDGDGNVGEPAAPQVADTMRVEIVEEHHSKSDIPTVDRAIFADLPCSAVALRAIARGALSGVEISERQLAGPGRPISGPKFRRLRDKLIDLGYLRWASDLDHRQGVALTRKGLLFFQQVAGGGDSYAPAGA